MLYLILFLEGIITFISPCMLPMLPVYVSYFGGSEAGRSTVKTLKNAIGFVLGFTAFFVLLGAFSGTVGAFMQKYKNLLNIVTGAAVVFFGLNYMGVFRLNIFRGINKSMVQKQLGFFSAFLFGIAFSVGWTPCVGAFLGSALMMASRQGSASAGTVMLLAYSLGLGVPFVVSAIVIDKLKNTFNYIKSHYSVINAVCGLFLVAVGISMMTGLLGKLIALLG